MLILYTGVPGAKKTAFCVSNLNKIEQQNKVNLVRNLKSHKKNLPLIEEYKDDFSYREYEEGSGHTLEKKIEVLDDDYFDMFEQDFDDLRPDDYYYRATIYNQIIERIYEREGDTKLLTLFPVRTIYSNINNLKIDYVRSLEYDWRDCPDGSVISIDEVQLVPPYDKIRDVNNPIIQSLTVHRHRGFDFHFITQYPALLHPTVKILIGLHYHLTLPYGLNTKVYQFGSCRDRPNNIVNKMNCERKFKFNPPNSIFKLYKSTTINTHKKRVPYKIIIAMILLAVVGLSVFVWGMRGASNSAFFDDGNEVVPPVDDVAPVDDVPSDDKKAISPIVPTSSVPPLDDKTVVRGQSYSSANTVINEQQSLIDEQAFLLQQQQIELEQARLPTTYKVEINNDIIRVAGVVMMGNECQAFNEFGDRLTMPYDECISYQNRIIKARSSTNSYDIANDVMPSSLTQ